MNGDIFEFSEVLADGQRRRARDSARDRGDEAKRVETLEAERLKAAKVCLTDSVLRMQHEIMRACQRAEQPGSRTATNNVAITGPSGCGKTRFLMSYAAANHGVIYCETAGGTSKQVLQEVVDRIALHPVGPFDEAVAWAQGKPQHDYFAELSRRQARPRRRILAAERGKAAAQWRDLRSRLAEWRSTSETPAPSSCSTRRSGFEWTRWRPCA